MEKSGAASDQLMTPATDSAQNSLTPPATSPRLIIPYLLKIG